MRWKDGTLRPMPSNCIIYTWGMSFPNHAIPVVDSSQWRHCLRPNAHHLRPNTPHIQWRRLWRLLVCRDFLFLVFKIMTWISLSIAIRNPEESSGFESNHIVSGSSTRHGLVSEVAHVVSAGSQDHVPKTTKPAGAEILIALTCRLSDDITSRINGVNAAPASNEKAEGFPSGTQFADPFSPCTC